MADFEEQSSENFFNQFLDDYFAESDEHLAIVKRCLLSLEQYVDHSVEDKLLLDEILRSFHTLKGISGMVGLTPAEQLAHELEGYLRALHKKRRLSSSGFDTLLEATRTLEHVIDSYRKHDALPEIGKQLDSLAALTNDSEVLKSAEVPTPSSKELVTNALSAAREWRVIFVPTQSNSEAGINVNSVRTKLLELGEIVRSTPLIEAGEIAFEFRVKTAADESQIEAARALGLNFELVSPEQLQELEHKANLSAEADDKNPPGASGAISVRVDLARLDNLMLLLSDLVVSRARLESTLKPLRSSLPAGDWRRLQEINARIGRQLRNLRNGVMRVRMVPIAEAFERMRFVVRELTRQTGKLVRLELKGQETEIDKYLVERLMDPLLHLVRNAVSHGIEGEEERRRAGKPVEGNLILSAQTDGDLVVIQISDDGCGIDVSKIADRFPDAAISDENGEIDPSVLLDILCTPGFSTREEADRASGRGVGMDVVRSVIRELDGSMSVKTRVGHGTKFRVTVPLTLAIADALIASVGKQRFAINQAAVHEIVEIQPDAIKHLENNEIVLHRENVLPLVRLSRLFNLSESHNGPGYAFVIGTGSRATGLVVDKVIGLREVVVRSLSDPLIEVTGISGATELGDGQPILMLDTVEILDLVKTSTFAKRN